MYACVEYTDIALMEYLRENMREDQIFFLASQDEASYSYALILQILAAVKICCKICYYKQFILPVCQA